MELLYFFYSIFHDTSSIIIQAVKQSIHIFTLGPLSISKEHGLILFPSDGVTYRLKLPVSALSEQTLFLLKLFSGN